MTGYTADPTVLISDTLGSGTGASATAFTDIGAVTAITITNPGAGYITTGGIKKFQDGLAHAVRPERQFLRVRRSGDQQ